MSRVISAQLGLLAFGVAVCAGLIAGNSFTTIVTRALTAMGVVAVLAYLCGWTTRLVLRDQLLARRLKIEREHHEERKAAAARSGTPAS